MHVYRSHRSQGALQTLLCTSIALGFALCSQAQSEDAESISIDLAFENIVVQLDQQGQAVFTGAPIDADAGAPALPRVTLKVLLPPDADLSSVVAALADTRTERVTGNWDLPAMPPPNGPRDGSWPEGLDRATGRDPVVYEKNAFHPDSFLGCVGVGQMREWKVAEVQVTPFRYNPVAQTLDRLLQCKLKLTFRRQPDFRPIKTRAPRVASYFRKEVSSSVINFNEMVNQYDTAQSR